MNDYSSHFIFHSYSRSWFLLMNQMIINDRSVSRSGINAELLIEGFGLSYIQRSLIVEVLKIFESFIA